MGSTIVLDLSETTFIDSRIVGAIVYAAERSRQAAEHGLIVVAPPTAGPRRVLELVGAAQFLRIVDDLQTALGSLSNLRARVTRGASVCSRGWHDCS